MSYVDGFVVPVPAGNKDAYRAMAEKAAVLFRKHGATRVVECWGDEVPDGQRTDFKRAVAAEDGEAVVFSWIEWPSKDKRDEAMPKFMEDAKEIFGPDMPFDGKRMIFGGFAPIVDQGA